MAQSLNHWAAREVPGVQFKKEKVLLSYLRFHKKSKGGGERGGESHLVKLSYFLKILLGLNCQYLVRKKDIDVHVINTSSFRWRREKRERGGEDFAFGLLFCLLETMALRS